MRDLDADVGIDVVEWVSWCVSVFAMEGGMHLGEDT